MARLIKIFIAGAIHLQEERDRFRLVASNLQSEYDTENNDVAFIVKSYENFNYHFDENGQQKNYNNFIEKEANAVFFIVDGKIGKETRKEFDVAYKSYKNRKSPLIVVLGKNLDNSNIELQQELNEIHQYGVNYSSISELDVKIEKSIRQIERKLTIKAFKKKLVYSFSVIVTLLFLLMSALLIKNDILGQHDISKMKEMYSTSNYIDALPLFHESVRGGDSEAFLKWIHQQFILAYINDHVIPGDKDSLQARWLKESANQGLLMQGR